MGWRKWPFWIKAVIAILITFVVSEIVLRSNNFTGILSANALNMVLSSSRRLVLLIDNVLLFLIVLVFPAYLAQRMTRKIKTKHKRFSIASQTGKKTSIISVKTIPSIHHHLEGKGLIYGSIIAILYILLDFFVLKPFVPECLSFCGFENAFALAFSIIYMAIGTFLVKTKH